MPRDIESLPMSEILTYEEIITVAETAAALGITRIKITGGEPLVRRDCCNLIRSLKNVEGIEQVTLTTNGVLLSEFADELADIGIDGINISIDTLNAAKYSDITGSDCLDAVLSGLDAAVAAGLRVKINAVSLDRDVYDLIELARKSPVDVRFIEMMPIGYGRDYESVSHTELIPEIRARYESMTEDETVRGNGPARYYRIDGFAGHIGFISAVHRAFCDSCNRIRLTPQGFLKSCLCYDTGVDLRSIIRDDTSEEAVRENLKRALTEAILCKPEAHSFEDTKMISEKHVMSRIGG